MSKTAEKKEALLTKKERLLKELRELDTTIEGVMEEEWKEQGELIVKNIDALLDLVPLHTDGRAESLHEDENCLRCKLLSSVDGEWPYMDFGIDIAMTNRKTSIDNAVQEETTVLVQQEKKGTRIPKSKPSANQLKAKELGIVSRSKVPTKKLNRVLEIDESAADLPEGWGV